MPDETQKNNFTPQVKGTRQAPAMKIYAIEGLKSGTENGQTFISGYANTKNRRDRYGDVPAVYPKMRSYVYELTEFRKNPVLLLDHRNAVDCVAGSFVELQEDENGLRFKAVFSDSDYAPVRHARTVYSEGHARGLSIAGRFHYENPEHTDQLTLAEIYEISLVAVPADPDALSDTQKKPEPQKPESKPEERAAITQDDSKNLSELYAAISGINTGLEFQATLRALKNTNPPEAGKGE